MQEIAHALFFRRFASAQIRICGLPKKALIKNNWVSAPVPTSAMWFISLRQIDPAQPTTKSL